MISRDHGDKKKFDKVKERSWKYEGQFVSLSKIKGRKVMNEVQGKLAGEILSQAMYHGLEVEVVLEAMQMIKDDPSLDSTQALSMAAYEWDVLV